MEGMPNRKQRRLMAKQAGFLKKKSNSTFKEILEINQRSREIGKQIHLANVERQLRMKEEKSLLDEQQKLQHLVEKGYTPEDALKILQGEKEEN
jgi:hypothetical protein